jgi:hypothetical protein
MSGLEMLRRLLAFEDVAPVPAPEVRAGLPPAELRFALEYREPPDLAREQSALAVLLGSDSFVLEPLFDDGEPDLARILVLRFPGIERTLPPPALFEIAYALADARGLVRAEPDLGSRLYADPDEPRAELRPEMADLLDRLCRVDTPAPSDLRWALGTIGVLRAWARFPARGNGILVGQPDTGIAEHVEVDRAAIDFTRTANIVEGGADPTDPLTPGTANPGHGTGTASLVISREAERIIGAAPAATLVPIRCTTDVKIFDGTPVARAIAHATQVGCDVITMSLGGVPSLAVEAAVEAAVAKGVIVLAAAGNCVRTVVYPARYESVIAVAGINIAEKPWRGSCRGGSVDVSAPAELVWRAERQRPQDPTNGIGGGQGTSFAVALTAGVAALWLSHHGRDAVRAEAQRRSVPVQVLFRNALQSTARRPSGWDADDFGTGIVDAEQLLGLPLDRIPVEEVLRADGGLIARLLDEVGGVKTPDPAFDWSRYGLEVASVLFDDVRFGRAPTGPTAEARAPGLRPSANLAARAGRSPDPRLRDIATRHGRPAVQPYAPGPAGVAVPPRLIQILGRPEGRAFEAAGEVSLEAARATLRAGGLRRTLDEAERRLSAIEAREAQVDPAVTRLRRDLLARGEEALNRVAVENAPRVVTTDRVALEALVSLTDRPAVRVENGTIDPNHPELGPWRGDFVLTQPEVEAVFRAVGRIDGEDGHIGTGFLVGDGVVMTNRHVIEAFAAPVPRRDQPKQWVLESDRVVIDFSDRATGGPTAFRIKSVIAAGPRQIGDEPIDFAKLDMALLEVETTNAAGRPLPQPVRLQGDVHRINRARRIFTVGYPARPQVLPTDASGALRMDVITRLRAIFGLQYGVKYFSPGVVAAALGTVSGDPRSWVFDHDATTLAGSSGSAAVDFGGTIAALGLHFAGDWLRTNHAHALGAVKASGDFDALGRLDWID